MEEIEKVEGTVVEKKEEIVIPLEAMAIIDEAHALTITNDATLNRAAELGGILTKYLRMLEEKRKEKTKKLKDYIETEITKPFKKVTTPLKEAKANNDNKIIAYREKKALEILELQKDQELLAREKGIEEMLPAPTQGKTVRTQFGSMTAKKKMDCEVEDFSKIADKYKLFNKPLVMKEVNKGVRNIDGVRIFPKEEISYR